MARHLIFCLFLLAMPTIADGQAPAADVGKRVALVIGNGTYERPEDSLPNPPNDATAMAVKLRALGFQVIEALDLDYRGMRVALRDFDRALEGADAGLFFYAGHGMEYRGRNYLFPIDAVLESEGDIGIGLIDVGQVLHVMETRVPTRLMFLDACRNNPLARRFRGSIGATRSSQIGTGLAPIDAAVGTFIAYATAPGQLAEDGRGQNSPFSAAMLQHLDEPGLDVDQLMRRVRNSVLEATNERQIPWNSSSLRGSFVLNESAPNDAPSAATAAGTPSSIDQPDDDREAWAFAQGLNTLQGFQAYLDAHCPGGRYCGFARAAIASKTETGGQQLALRDPDADLEEAERQRAEAPASSDQGNVILAQALAEGWGRRRYKLQNGPTQFGGCDRNKSFARPNMWQPSPPVSSPITIREMASEAESEASTSTGFDMTADLAIHVAGNELYLVESKRYVGSARGFCRIGGLGKGIFQDLMANNAHFAGQKPRTLSYGYDQIGSMEFASALVTLQASEGVRTCLAFIGFRGKLSRVDGFFCRDVDQAIDASEVEAIISRIRIDGVFG